MRVGEETCEMSMVFETTNDNLLTVHATGRLQSEDYQRFVPAVDQLLRRNGSVRILLDVQDVDDGCIRAEWQDRELSLKPLGEVERLAMVGDNTWELWMASFCQPFTRAEVRFYERSEAAAARAWIEEHSCRPCSSQRDRSAKRLENSRERSGE